MRHCYHIIVMLYYVLYVILPQNGLAMFLAYFNQPFSFSSFSLYGIYLSIISFLKSSYFHFAYFLNILLDFYDLFLHIILSALIYTKNTIHTEGKWNDKMQNSVNLTLRAVQPAFLFIRGTCSALQTSVRFSVSAPFVNDKT